MKQYIQKSPVMSIKIKIMLLLSVMIITGLFSLYLGQDCNYDLQNYHYSNGFSFFNLNIDQDFLMAGALTYLNPLADAIQYLEYPLTLTKSKRMVLIC